MFGIGHVLLTRITWHAHRFSEGLSFSKTEGGVGDLEDWNFRSKVAWDYFVKEAQALTQRDALRLDPYVSETLMATSSTSF